MAMMMNNPWMYLVMLALFGNGAWGNNGGRSNADYVALSNQINDNNNNQWAREAIQGNGFAISQLAQNLNVDYNAMSNAVNNVVAAVNAVGAQNGMGFAAVNNAINLGNLNIIQQLKDCCCALQTSIRVENGLVRAEVAAFRQAWENSRYQDVVAEKTRLQTELDLLRQSQGTAALIAPVTAEVQKLEYQMQNLLNVYGSKTAAASTTGA